VASPGDVFSWMTVSSREAQAEIRNAIAKSETAHTAKRGIMIGTKPNRRHVSCKPLARPDEVSGVRPTNIEDFSGQLQDKQFSHR
jgi:hypothetical protein